MSSSPVKTGHGDMSPTRNVEINVFNVKGQRVRSLVNGVYQAGEHFVVWDGKDDNGQNVSGGIYLYQMQTGDFIQTKRMVIIK